MISRVYSIKNIDSFKSISNIMLFQLYFMLYNFNWHHKSSSETSQVCCFRSTYKIRCVFDEIAYSTVDWTSIRLYEFDIDIFSVCWSQMKFKSNLFFPMYRWWDIKLAIFRMRILNSSNDNFYCMMLFNELNFSQREIHHCSRKKLMKIRLRNFCWIELKLFIFMDEV